MATPRSKELTNKRLGYGIALLFFLMLLLIWQLLALNLHFAFYFASPSAILSQVILNTSNGVLPYSFLITGFETVIGFIIGILTGVTVGFLLWYSRLTAQIAKPYVLILGAIPIFAFAPIIIIWFGVGIIMKVVLAAFGVFLVSLTQAYEGAQNVNPDEYKLMKLYEATRWQILEKVIFPSSLSWVLASMKLNIGVAILGAFIGEFISSDAGLGHFMLTAGSLYNVPEVFAGAFFLVILSLLLTWLIGYIEKNRLKIIEKLSV